MFQNQSELRLRISAADLSMILATIDTYAHNLAYRDLRDRLQRQTTRWDESEMPRRSSQASPAGAR